MAHLMNHFQPEGHCGCHQGNIPSTNISESKDAFRIEMALPGVEKKDIRIVHEKGFLTIRVESQEEEKNYEQYTRQEFDFTRTSRTFRIGDKIDTDNIAARYENGLLILHLPKKEAYVSKPSQSIAVE
jgi:HSP20 family protein